MGTSLAEGFDENESHAASRNNTLTLKNDKKITQVKGSEVELITS